MQQNEDLQLPAIPPSDEVHDILLQAAMTAQYYHLPTFGSHDILLTMLQRDRLLLMQIFQKTPLKATNIDEFGKILTAQINSIPRRRTQQKKIEPADELKEVQRKAQEYAKEQGCTSYSQKHVLKAIFSSDKNPQINAACSRANINRHWLARQIK
jgi:ATP-dependent Clp protease ATP-binding subunit ClpA